VRDLVIGAQNGAREAFAALVHMTSDRMYVLAARILRDNVLAEDALKGALIAVWRQLPTLRASSVTSARATPASGSRTTATGRSPRSTPRPTRSSRRSRSRRRRKPSPRRAERSGRNTSTISRDALEGRSVDRDDSVEFAVPGIDHQPARPPGRRLGRLRTPQRRRRGPSSRSIPRPGRSSMASASPRARSPPCSRASGPCGWSSARKASSSGSRPTC